MIHPLSAHDRERCMDLAERVGWPRETDKWELLFALGRGYGTTGEGGALSAMVVLPAHEGATFVAMMVVDPRAQGRGLGRALLDHAMRDATPPLLLYATARGRPLYERLGFREVDQVRKLVGVPRPTRAPPHLRPAAPADHRAVVDADAGAFGVRRAPLIERLLERAERTVVDGAGGFAVRWHNGHLAVVGPVVAADEDGAVALLAAALEGCDGLVRIDVPVRSSRLAAFARSLGLDEHDPAPLMTWPAPWLPGDRARYHAIALQAFG